MFGYEIETFLLISADMTTLFFHILLALSAQDDKAPGILRRLRQDTSGSLVVYDRSFYAALERLVERAWVTADGEGQGVTYRLAPAGRRQLQSESARYQRAVTLLRERI